MKPPPIKANVSGEPRIDVEPNEEPLKHDIALYQWCREHFRRRDARAAFAGVSPGLRGFLSEPVKWDGLRAFLYKNQFREYTHWSRLDEVIEQKAKLIAELGEELDHYARLRRE